MLNTQRLYSSLLYIVFLLTAAPTSVDSEPIQCDIFDLACRLRIQQQQQAFVNPVRDSRTGRCNFQDIWLIPGKADSSCTRPDSKHLVDIDPRQVSISPPVVKFPGCFTVEIKNVHVRDHEDILTNSFFAKSEYQWLNVREFGEVKCQNASSNGCGGYGNNCYYCDVCESLKELDTTSNSTASTLSEQFRGLNCPRRPGLYTFRRQFCFNDWSSFDTNGDCKLDFLDTEKSDIKSALASLQQVGYGTIVAKIRIAYNATKVIERKKAVKETQIEKTVMEELEGRKASWDINKGQFEKFSSWYVDYRKSVWHREEYLPWLLYENEIFCLRLTFDVCERIPRQRLYGGQGYTCE